MRKPIVKTWFCGNRFLTSIRHLGHTWITLYAMPTDFGYWWKDEIEAGTGGLSWDRSYPDCGSPDDFTVVWTAVCCQIDAIRKART